MAEKLTKSVFAENLNTRFDLLHPVRKVDLELSEVESLSADPDDDDSFSLVFVAPGREYFEQAIYPVEHEKLGAFELFLVPIRQDAGGVYYQAIFNRMTIRPLQKKAAGGG